MENMKFEQVPKREEEAQTSGHEKKKNSFDLSEEELKELYEDNDNRDMYEKYKK